jgi:hypothetical protein
MTPFQKQEEIKARILGSYNVPAPIVKSEETKELGTEEKKEEDTTEEVK